MSAEKWKNFIKTLGPGIMFAGTCVGGSHLVQSTKAGAFYGMGLLVIVLAANLFKYPFFEFASRYTNATGDSILEGYYKQGSWVLKLYGLVTIFSMFIITAAIAVFTAGLMSNIFLVLFNLEVEAWISTLILFVIVFGLLFKGEFKILDLTLKIVGIVLVLTVFIAFFALLFGEEMPTTQQGVFDIIWPDKASNGLRDYSGLAFSIALMGWMPIAVDMSSWTSLWTQERIKQTKYYPTLKETLLDFNIGYIITVILAICFLTIGTYVLYGSSEYTEEDISTMTGLTYAQTLVSMFTKAVGDWSFYVIMLAAFATMFGTTITLIDGYCRSIERTVSLLKPKQPGVDKTAFHKKGYLFWVASCMLGSFLIIKFYVSNLGQIINLATTLSFIIAPFAAMLNFRLMFDRSIPEEKRPPQWLKVLAILGIIFLSVFSILFLVI